MSFFTEFLFPKKTLKIRLAILIVLLFVVFAGFFFERKDKSITGVVLDCASNQPIPNVEVSVNQRSWGFIDGSLVWDRDYISKATTSNSGEFTITYEVGSSTNIKTEKEGYITAWQFENPKQGIIIRMLQGNKPGEVTYNCKSSSECLQTTIEDGVQVTKNVCVE
jgi:hypothetical protein